MVTQFNDLWTIPASSFTNEQEFLAPGTWTCPSTTTWVEVIVVGGGGGGGAGTFFSSPPAVGSLGGAGGGGGGVRRKWLPVSGPVPVTVGAGGAGTTGTVHGPSPAIVLVAGSGGGTSAFGPLGPGPIPAIPPSTVAVGGGGLGGTSVPTEPGTSGVSPLGIPWSQGQSAPPIGGGGGGGAQSFTGPNPIVPPVGVGQLGGAGGDWGCHGEPGWGLLGTPSIEMGVGGGAREGVIGGPVAENYTNTNRRSMRGYDRFGGGGSNFPAPADQYNYHIGRMYGGGGAGQAGQDGTGGGGGGAPSGTTDGASGGDGIVIVRWKE